MKERIEKLIREYERKVDLCDRSISLIDENMKIARKNNDKYLFGVHREEKREWQARRSAIYQAKVDIETLLDFA